MRGGRTEAIWASTRQFLLENPDKTAAIVTPDGTFLVTLKGQDVLPWLDEAVTDWEAGLYRSDLHYVKLFKGAAREIRRLRALS